MQMVSDQPKRLAYADPPYIGMSAMFKKVDPNAAEVDHNELLARLQQYDGFALSCSSTTLRTILMLPNCPPNIRIASWVKPYSRWHPGVYPNYSWEPVLFMPARKHDRNYKTVQDHLVFSNNQSVEILGQKPRAVCFWIFKLLDALYCDKLEDLFPGSGQVSRCWQEFAEFSRVDRHGNKQMSLFSADL
jgi:hypothetical protein